MGAALWNKGMPSLAVFGLGGVKPTFLAVGSHGLGVQGCKPCACLETRFLAGGLFLLLKRVEQQWVGSHHIPTVRVPAVGTIAIGGLTTIRCRLLF